MSDTDSLLILSITTTVPDRAQGLALARALVEARLAACVQVDEQPITSCYHWQGQLCEEREWRVMIKTTPAQEAALRAKALALHPYELPQWVVAAVPASAAYAAWVRDETAG